MVILTTGFGKFEFSRTFSLLLLPDKQCEKVQIEIPQMYKRAESSNWSKQLDSLKVIFEWLDLLD